LCSAVPQATDLNGNWSSPSLLCSAVPQATDLNGNWSSPSLLFSILLNTIPVLWWVSFPALGRQGAYSYSFLLALLVYGLVEQFF